MNAEYYVCSLFCLLLSLAQSIETTLDFDATDLFSPYVCLYRSHHITKHTEYTVRSACSHFNFIDLPMIGSGCAGWRMNISNHIYLFVVDHQQSTQQHRNWHFVICFFFLFYIFHSFYGFTFLWMHNALAPWKIGLCSGSLARALDNQLFWATGNICVIWVRTIARARGITNIIRFCFIAKYSEQILY